MPGFFASGARENRAQLRPGDLVRGWRSTIMILLPSSPVGLRSIQVFIWSGVSAPTHTAAA